MFNFIFLVFFVSLIIKESVPFLFFSTTETLEAKHLQISKTFYLKDIKLFKETYKTSFVLSVLYSLNIAIEIIY